MSNNDNPYQYSTIVLGILFFTSEVLPFLKSKDKHNGIIDTLQFQGSHLIYEHDYQCKIEEHEFNNTSNISAEK